MTGWSQIVTQLSHKTVDIWPKVWYYIQIMKN